MNHPQGPNGHSPLQARGKVLPLLCERHEEARGWGQAPHILLTQIVAKPEAQVSFYAMIVSPAVVDMGEGARFQGLIITGVPISAHS